MKSLLRSISVVSIPFALAACSGMNTGSSSMESPQVPSAIAVPTGHKMAFTLKGAGLLNYECRAKSDAPGGAEWVLASPDAALKDRNDALVGKYYGGPTWEHGDGSKVTGKQLATSPAPTAGNIPWQLVQANPTTGAGTLSGVTYIQRINTNAGVAPSEPCSATAAGKKAQVRYAADYVFYKAA